MNGDTSNLEYLMRHAVAASLAGGMIAASQRAHSAAEAAAIWWDAYWAMYPDENDPNYQAWLGAGRRDLAHV